MIVESKGLTDLPWVYFVNVYENSANFWFIIRRTWPKLTLVCTRATDNKKKRTDGVWFRKRKDGSSAKWTKFAPYPAKLSSERNASDVCIWEDIVYVVGGYTTEIWTLNVR